MSIRLRLALWYTGFLALLALLLAPAICFTLERELLQGVDRQLSPLAEQVVTSMQGHPRVAQGLGAGQREPQAPGARSLSDDLDRFASPGTTLQLLDSNGRVVALSTKYGTMTVPVPSGAIASAWWGAPSSFTAAAAGVRYRSVLAPIPGIGEPRGFVLAARALDQEDAALARMRNLLIAGNLLGLLLAAAVGWLIAGKGLRPINEITETARAIALSQGFGRRLNVNGSQDEVGRLAVTFNEMLASLDTAFSAQRRFVADASHELRSPLTSIRSNIEILQRALDAPREDRAEALADVAAEVDRMSKLTSDLLLLARADAGHKIEMSKVALDALLRDVHRQLQPHSNGVALELGPLDGTFVLGNTAWLKQLLLILLDNALKYTPKGGSVTLGLERDGGVAVIKVRDTGIGITPEDLPCIFDRFYRADRARARNEGGAGLGLAVARWIAHEHGGEIEVQSKVGKGTTFAVRIPAK